MGKKSFLKILLMGILVSILVFTILDISAILFSLEVVIFLHAIMFTLFGIAIGYVLINN